MKQKERLHVSKSKGVTVDVMKTYGGVEVYNS